MFVIVWAIIALATENRIKIISSFFAVEGRADPPGLAIPPLEKSIFCVWNHFLASLLYIKYYLPGSHSKTERGWIVRICQSVLYLRLESLKKWGEEKAIRSAKIFLTDSARQEISKRSTILSKQNKNSFSISNYNIYWMNVWMGESRVRNYWSKGFNEIPEQTWAAQILSKQVQINNICFRMYANMWNFPSKKY